MKKLEEESPRYSRPPTGSLEPGAASQSRAGGQKTGIYKIFTLIYIEYIDPKLQTTYTSSSIQTQRCFLLFLLFRRLDDKIWVDLEVVIVKQIVHIA